MKITEAMRRKMAWEMIGEISTHAQSTDPKRDWQESQEAVCAIYRIVHSIDAPSCRKNHGDWLKPVDAAIRREKKR